MGRLKTSDIMIFSLFICLNEDDENKCCWVIPSRIWSFIGGVGCMQFTFMMMGYLLNVSHNITVI